MFFADDINGNRTYIDDADPQQVYVCPACKMPVIQKHGKIMAHHFAHKAKDTCDPWYSGKTSPWHKEMQNLFPPHCQEVVVCDNKSGEYHIADVVFKGPSRSCVIEFQHSSISYNDFVARSDFYINQGYYIIWVFDFCTITPQKEMYYTEDSQEENPDLFQVVWPGKDRLRFLDEVNFCEYADNMQIFFHVNIGAGHKILIESDNRVWERWEYINPFQRERLFIELDLIDLAESFLRDVPPLKEFFASPYSEETFYNNLKNIGKRQF